MTDKKRVKANEQSEPYRVSATLMMEAAVFCEMWEHFYQITWRHIPDGSNLRHCNSFSFETTPNAWTGCFRGFHQLLQFTARMVAMNVAKFLIPLFRGPQIFEKSTSSLKILRAKTVT